MISYHVHTHADGGWCVRREGSIRAARRFSTKRQARMYARSLARWSEIIVHRIDGTVMGVEVP